MNKKTIRKLFSFILTIILLGTLTVCDMGGGGGGGGGGSTSGGSGSVVITLPSGSSLSRNISARAAYPDPAIVDRLVCAVQLSSGSSVINRTARSGETISVNVGVGRWRVYVEAFDGSTVYGVGESYVDVVAGQHNSVYIKLSPPGEPPAPPPPLPPTPITILNDDYNPENLFDLGVAPLGYTPVDYRRTVIVKNTGTEPTGILSITHTGGSDFTIPTSLPNIAVGDDDDFIVSPASSLTKGKYSATVTVSNSDNTISASFTVTFEVVDVADIWIWDGDLVSDIETEIDNALKAGNDVYVKGTKTDGDAALTITIPTGRTVTWEADYESTDSIEVFGAGNLIITGPTPSLYIEGNVVIKGGTVTGIGDPSSPYTIYVSGGKLAILGGNIVKHVDETYYVYSNANGVVYLANAAGIPAYGISGLSVGDCSGYYANASLLDRFNAGSYFDGGNLNSGAPLTGLWNATDQKWN